MLFAAVAQSFAAGKRVGVACPRVDVINELAPRLAAAFPSVPPLVLHGKSSEKFQVTPLILLTTHQLLRFRTYFDVLIIDEVDAFPFVDNHMLEFATTRALRPVSALIYLTATPTENLVREVVGNRLPATVLPARFHRRPLVVPEFMWLPPVREMIERQCIPDECVKLLQELLQDGLPVMLFLPTIAVLEKILPLLQSILPAVAMAGASSRDEERQEKVAKFRTGEIQLLLTTTILERGVTIPGVSVVVLDAGHRVFNRAALVQI
jgi:competence protein ComFA